jgi:hypothetical protein
MYALYSHEELKLLAKTLIIYYYFPGVIIFLAIENDVLGSDKTENVGTGTWCWLKRDIKDYMFWMFLTGKGWELLCYLLTTSLYVLLKFYLVRRHPYENEIWIYIQMYICLDYKIPCKSRMREAHLNN